MPIPKQSVNYDGPQCPSAKLLLLRMKISFITSMVIDWNVIAVPYSMCGQCVVGHGMVKPLRLRKDKERK